MIDAARTDTAGKNLRDGYVAEHLEIATYDLLERVARIAGDTETAIVAERNRADEEAMVERINAAWDKGVIESLEQEGVPPSALATAGSTQAA